MTPAARRETWQPDPIGLCRDRFHRYYWAGEGPMVGVTSAIGVVDKPTVYAWAKRETAACAIRNIGHLVGMVVEGGAEAATDWLKRIPDYRRDQAADLGARVHIIAERIAREQDVDVDALALPYVNGYRRFLDDFEPRFVELEFMVASLRHKYGGTGDAIAEIDGHMWLLDIKTGSGTYGETALQLAAYANADFIGKPNDPEQYPIPKIERFGVIHVHPDYPKGYELQPYKVTRSDFRAFVHARHVHRWVNERARKVKGSPIAPTPRALPAAVEQEVVAA